MLNHILASYWFLLLDYCFSWLPFVHNMISDISLISVFCAESSLLGYYVLIISRDQSCLLFIALDSHPWILSTFNFQLNTANGCQSFTRLDIRVTANGSWFCLKPWCLVFISPSRLLLCGHYFSNLMVLVVGLLDFLNTDYRLASCLWVLALDLWSLTHWLWFPDSWPLGLGSVSLALQPWFLITGALLLSSSYIVFESRLLAFGGGQEPLQLEYRLCFYS